MWGSRVELSVHRECPPSMIRVSLGSAITLGLTRGIQNVKPTTVYLLTYYSGRCTANCAFCSQARTSRSRACMLSRVTWPALPLEKVMGRIGEVERGNLVKRVCIQAMKYPGVFEEMLSLVKRIRGESNIPISVSCHPLSQKRIRELANAEIDRIGIPLDAATKELFKRVKGSLVGGPYVWESHIGALRNAVGVMGKNRVSTHLIVGLGERGDEMVEAIQRMEDMGVYPGLFALTPISGTNFERRPQPPLKRYRLIQLAHYLITHREARFEEMSFDDRGEIANLGVSKERLKQIIDTGTPFMTSGCPGCNRPYYNERPGGPTYNYPRKPLPRDIIEIKKQLDLA